MNRRQLGFIVLVNAVVSLAIALGVVWAVEARRPDPEELAALYTPVAAVVAPVAAAPAGAVASISNTAPTVAALSDPKVAVEPTPPPAPGEEQIYAVQAGDSLFAIAERFHVAPDQIMAANQMKDPNLIYSGQRLKIPAKGAVVVATTQDAAPGATAVVTTTAAAPTTGNPTATTAPSGLQIQTVDAPGDVGNEAVLIVNNSDQAYNLQGWRLERQNGPGYAFGGVQLFPGSSVWVHSSDGTDTSIALYWKQSAPVWQSGAVARLINAQGEQVATYTVP